MEISGTNSLANREIKDGVFKLLFESPENAAELYYALTGIKCSPEEIQIITITTTISGKLKNDLALVVRGRVMVIGEHQSTPNENMPVRLLMYSGQLYEKWFKMKGDEKLIYGNKLYKIPTPEFVVFYNGIADRPEKEILKLSTAFEEPPDKDLGFLELEVPVYNINRDMNSELFKRSEKLKHYAEFVAKLREFQKTNDDYSQAVKETVNHCIENGILSEFLKEHGGKIVSILFTEYNEETAKRVYAEEYAEDRVEDRVEEIAISMLNDSFPINVITKHTGLSEVAIRNLQANIAREPMTVK